MIIMNPENDTIKFNDIEYRFFGALTNNSVLQKTACIAVKNLLGEFPTSPLTIEEENWRLEISQWKTRTVFDNMESFSVMLVTDADIIHKTMVTRSYYESFMCNNPPKFDANLNIHTFFNGYKHHPLPFKRYLRNPEQFTTLDVLAQTLVVYNDTVHFITNIFMEKDGISVHLLSQETGEEFTIGAFDDKLDYYVSVNINPLEGEPGI